MHLYKLTYSAPITSSDYIQSVTHTGFVILIKGAKHHIGGFMLSYGVSLTAPTKHVHVPNHLQKIKY